MGFIGGLKTIVELLQLVKFFFTKGKELLNEKEEKEAAKKKAELSNALDLIEAAKTPEEKSEAIRAVTGNSF